MFAEQTLANRINVHDNSTVKNINIFGEKNGTLEL